MKGDREPYSMRQQWGKGVSNMSVATVEMNTGQMAAVKEGVSYINVIEAAYTHKEAYKKLIYLLTFKINLSNSSLFDLKISSL